MWKEHSNKCVQTVNLSVLIFVPLKTIKQTLRLSPAFSLCRCLFVCFLRSVFGLPFPSLASIRPWESAFIFHPFHQYALDYRRAQRSYFSLMLIIFCTSEAHLFCALKASFRLIPFHCALFHKTEWAVSTMSFFSHCLYIKSVFMFPDHLFFFYTFHF